MHPRQPESKLPLFPLQNVCRARRSQRDELLPGHGHHDRQTAQDQGIEAGVGTDERSDCIQADKVIEDE